MKRTILALAVSALLTSTAYAENIGVSMAKFDDNFLTVLRNGMADYAKGKTGVNLQIEDATNDVGKQLSQIQNFIAQKVDAIIVNPVDTDATPKMTQLAVEAKIPLVFVNRDVPELDCDMVGVDYERGSYEATSHLIAGGARRLLLLEEDLPITTTADRITGFRRAMSDAGLKVSDDQVRAVPTKRYDSLALPWQPEEAYRFAQTLLTDGHPDGVVTGNDYFALGLLRALAERDLAVPGDVAITGYGDHPYAAYLQTPLTTVRLPAAEVGTTAVDLLLQRLRSSGERPRKILIRPELVIRASAPTARPSQPSAESTAPPAAAATRQL